MRFSLAHFKPTLAASVIACIMIGMLAPRLLAFLPALLGLIFLVHQWGHAKQFHLSFLTKKVVFLTVAFGLMLASSQWSPEPSFSIERFYKIILLSIPSFILLSLIKETKLPRDKTYIKATIGIFISSCLFLVFEENSGHFFNKAITSRETNYAQLNRNFVIFSFLAIIALFSATRFIGNIKWKWAMGTTLATLSFLTLYFSESQTAQLNFLCGLFFLFIFPIKSKIIGKLFFGFIIILTLTMPVTLPKTTDFINTAISQETLRSGIIQKASTKARFTVWESTVIEIKKKPLLGHGLEAQRFMKTEHLKNHFKKVENPKALHAHNAILQIWVEFGLAGILLAILFLIFIYRKIYREENLDVRRLYLTLFAISFCSTMTGFGIWQGWQLGQIFIFTALAIMIGNTLKHKSAQS